MQLGVRSTSDYHFKLIEPIDKIRNSPLGVSSRLNDPFPMDDFLPQDTYLHFR
jgi:hypothetical protein